MISKETLDRINELSRKSKECVLSEEEKDEQNLLRLEYLKSFRKRFKQQLDMIEIVDEEKS